MRIVAAALIAGAIAFPSLAAGPLVRPATVTLRVGESTLLHGYQNAGGLSEGFPYHYEFFSDAPGVAAVRGFASGQSVTRPDPLKGNGAVVVNALQPGVAHVRAAAYPLDLATITVLPRFGPVEIRAESTRVAPGQQVILTAVVPGYEGEATFFWYRGRTGNKTQLLQASGDPEFRFTMTGPDPAYVWVEAFAGSVNSSAEIAIEPALPSRRRAAGR